MVDGSSAGPIGSGAGIKKEPSGNPERFSWGMVNWPREEELARKYPFCTSGVWPAMIQGAED